MIELIKTSLESYFFKIFFSMWVVIFTISLIPNISTIYKIITKKYMNIFEAGFLRFLMLWVSVALTIIIMIALIYNLL